ncbi:MAG TPA: NADH-quinone oxidoreductase subunit C [Desulfurivibrionaceae bacterium]|nr:NADH-quinone oxidoreductase subunit C [Desulfurivibrionaceae bacterium]
MLCKTLKEDFVALFPLAMVDTDYRAKGYNLDITITPTLVVEAAAIMARRGYTLEAATGVDWLSSAGPKPAKKAAPAEGEGGAVEPPAPAPVEEQMEVVYDYTHTGQELCRVVVRCRIPRANPELPTVSGVFAGANWHERETHDFFGIRFLGHPDLSPLLLPEDADFHPLLKDFQA